MQSKNIKVSFPNKNRENCGDALQFCVSEKNSNCGQKRALSQLCPYKSFSVTVGSPTMYPQLLKRSYPSFICFLFHSSSILFGLDFILRSHYVLLGESLSLLEGVLKQDSTSRHLPAKLPKVSFLRPTFSTSQTPTNVKMKLVNAVTEASHIASLSSSTPDICRMVAL